MFMFWGGVIVFPLMLLYTVISYSVFRGKIRATAGMNIIESDGREMCPATSRE
jgi:hypothetical protein